NSGHQNYRPQQARVADEQKEEEHLFIACHLTQTEAKKEWLIDSGCTNHMTNDADLFCDLDHTCRTKVTLGDGTTVDALGKGSIQIQTHKGTKLIRDVLLVPDLNQNLLSVTQMMQNGYSLYFNQNYCKIFDSNEVEIAHVKMKDRSFPV